MFRSIRWSLQLWHAGILGAALASFGTALFIGVSHAHFRRVDAELEGAARSIANAVMVPGAFDPGWRGPRDRGGGRGGRGDRGGMGGMGGPGAGGFGGGGPGGPGFGGPGGGGGGPGGMGMGPGGEPIDWWTSIPQDALRRIGENEQDQPYFAIWGNDGTIYRASPNATQAGVPTQDDLAAAPPPGAMNVVDVRQEPQFRTRAGMREVVLDGPYWGVHVVVGRSLATETKYLQLLRWELLGAGAAVMVIGLCGGWLLSMRATRPIRAITQTAQSITGSDLSRRIPLDETESELGSLAATLNETFDRLQTSFERQVRFTADASHELRTPLSVIHSQTELSLSRERSAGEYKQSLETCLRAAKRMKSLVESLLVLARADAGKLVLTVERFDIAAAAEECAALVAPRAAEKRVTVELKVQAVQVEADRTKVMQLLTNLLNNAIQYNQEGGRVMLSIEPGWDDVLIRVSDTGVGISPEDQVKVFERFFRADASRSRDVGGSGLGLAICRSIVEAHRGTITFSSKSGEGTTFTARLPVMRGRAAGTHEAGDPQAKPVQQKVEPAAADKK